VRIRYITGPDARIDSNDRGLAYGDGLFETMAVRSGVIRRFDYHLERLQLGAARLQLPLPDTAELEVRIAGLIDGLDYGLLKLVITRGSGPRGYAPPSAPEPVVILNATAHRPVPAAEIGAVTLTGRLGENENLAGIKHLCRLEQVLGQLELARHDADEGIMLSSSGAVIGGTSRNLFAVFGGRLVTPDLSRAGIAGVMRRWVLERCTALNITASEDVLGPDQLAAADELFMTNAIVGIQSVAVLDGRRFDSRAVASRLRGELEADDA